MPALFSRRANSIARSSLAAALFVLVVVPLALMVYVRTSFATGEHRDIAQPIAFDHRIHAHDLHIDCRFCHSDVARSASAGLPPTVACVGCHSKVWRESEQFAPIRASITTNRPVVWKRVNAVPDFVFFDHSIHVAKGVGCATCHGRVDQMAQVSQATPMSMRWCLDCHRDPGPNLRPTEEIASMEWAPPRDAKAADSLGAKLMQRYHVRSLTSCSTCHR
jgi:hypothetical protein